MVTRARFGVERRKRRGKPETPLLTTSSSTIQNTGTDELHPLRTYTFETLAWTAENLDSRVSRIGCQNIC